MEHERLAGPGSPPGVRWVQIWMQCSDSTAHIGSIVLIEHASAAAVIPPSTFAARHELLQLPSINLVILRAIWTHPEVRAGRPAG